MMLVGEVLNARPGLKPCGTEARAIGEVTTIARLVPHRTDALVGQIVRYETTYATLASSAAFVINARFPLLAER